MKHKNRKSRSDRPSGRQAMEQPEHSGRSAVPAASSLHQGQGPDFQTQDADMREQNEGIKQLYKDTPQQQPFSVDGDHPEFEREELPNQDEKKEE